MLTRSSILMRRLCTLRLRINYVPSSGRTLRPVDLQMARVACGTNEENNMLGRRLLLLAALAALVTPAQARKRGCSYGPRKANGKCPSRNGK